MKKQYYPSAEVLRAWKNDEQLEYQNVYPNGDASGWLDNQLLFDRLLKDNDWGDVRFRVKPTTSTRPWKPEEIPLGAVIRLPVNDGYSLEELITGRHGAWVYTTYNKQGIAVYRLFNEGWQCSKDGGKTWDICGITE